MTHAQEQEARKFAAGFEGQIDRLFFMEEIPKKKLENARRSYARSFETGEVPVLLWDDTLFGSAKDGFLLTDRRLYQKNFSERPSCSDLSGIVDFDISKESVGTVLSPQGTSSLNAIKIQYQCGNQEAVAARLIHMIYALTGRRNELSGQNDVSNTPLHSSSPLICHACGAPAPQNCNFCEYCGARLN